MYFIVWVVVEIKNIDLWFWFFLLFVEDLGVFGGFGCIVMSD